LNEEEQVMELKNHLEIGWNTFLKFIGPALLVTFVHLLVFVFSLGILGPVTSAGYFQSFLRAQREGRAPEVKDLFAHMSLFLPLLLFGFLAFCAIIIGFILLVLPGFAVMLLLVFACLYLLPLMTDKKMGLLAALQASWDMAVAQPIMDHVVIAIIYIALLSVGSSLPFVILFAQPLATFIVVSFYQERLGVLKEIVPR
jgi:hypothetical protein